MENDSEFFDPNIYGLYCQKKSKGILEINDDISIIKFDCYGNSRLSKTMENKKKSNKTLNFESQLEMVKDKKGVFIFHSNKNIQFPKKYGFKLLKTIQLQENIHTKYSINSAIEYVSLYYKSNFQKNMENYSKNLCELLMNKFHKPRNPDYHWLIKKLLNNDNYISSKKLTKLQENIVNFFKLSYPNQNMYINIGCSLNYCQNIGNQKDLIRKPNGKMGSMSDIVIIYNNNVFKLSSYGFFLLRGLEIPIKSRKETVQKSIARHSVHPEYLQMIKKSILLNK